MKSIKRIFKVILAILIVVISLLLVINIPITNIGHKSTKNDYSNWMSETLKNQQKIVDIAMLGAHDALTDNINYFSKLDPYETNGIMSGFTGQLTKGFIVKQSQTQINDPLTLLNCGVRYLDIRLTFKSGEWYTKHNYISDDFEVYANGITSFLKDNPGEFLILDFQHISGVDYSQKSDYDLFVSMLNDFGIISYAYEINDLSSVTYGDITNSGITAKVIIISKFEDSNDKILYYEDSIRSNWADSDNFEYVLNYLLDESKNVELANINNKFRVMQAVTTMQMSGTGIIKGIGSWSLINRAKHFNVYLLENDKFEEMLKYLPIVMVDNTDTNYKSFNDDIMNIILNFNVSLT